MSLLLVLALCTLSTQLQLAGLQCDRNASRCECCACAAGCAADRTHDAGSAPQGPESSRDCNSCLVRGVVLLPPVDAGQPAAICSSRLVASAALRFKRAAVTSIEHPPRA